MKFKTLHLDMTIDSVVYRGFSTQGTTKTKPIKGNGVKLDVDPETCEPRAYIFGWEDRKLKPGEDTPDERWYRVDANTLRAVVYVEEGIRPSKTSKPS